MLKAGISHLLTVARVTEHGLYLRNDEGDEVLLPNRYVSLANRVGDSIEVFVYHDSEDRLIATTDRPLIRVGEIASLKAVDRNMHGVFLDWGIFGKDLFLPNSNQQGEVTIGRNCIVYLYEDSVTGRCVATMKLKSYIRNEAIDLRPGQQVSILVSSRLTAGYRVVVDNRFWGMIYDDELSQPVHIGMQTQGYVRRITPDNRIDISLRPLGYADVLDGADTLRALLDANGGSLSLCDKSSPARIEALTGMSKKAFKRSLGVLLKRSEVELDEQGIRLNPKRWQKS